MEFEKKGLLHLLDIEQKSSAGDASKVENASSTLEAALTSLEVHDVVSKKSAHLYYFKSPLTQVNVSSFFFLRPCAFSSGLLLMECMGFFCGRAACLLRYVAVLSPCE